MAPTEYSPGEYVVRRDHRSDIYRIVETTSTGKIIIEKVYAGLGCTPCKTRPKKTVVKSSVAKLSIDDVDSKLRKCQTVIAKQQKAMLAWNEVLASFVSKSETVELNLEADPEIEE